MGSHLGIPGVAASRNVAGASCGSRGSSCSVWARCRSVVWPKKEEMQDWERWRSVAWPQRAVAVSGSVAGALQEIEPKKSAGGFIGVQMERPRSQMERQRIQMERQRIQVERWRSLAGSLRSQIERWQSQRALAAETERRRNLNGALGEPNRAVVQPNRAPGVQIERLG